MGGKAIAGVIAAVILFAMIFSIGAAYLLFVNSTNLLYGKALVGRSTAFQSVLYEQLLVATLLMNNHVAFYVNNTGGVNANITDIYVLGPSGSVLRCDGRGLQSPCANSTPALPIIVNVGKGSPTIDTGYTYGSGTYTVELVTERGGTFSATYPLSSTVLAAQALTSGAIGDIYLTFQTYKYYSVSLCAPNYCLSVQGKAFSVPASATNSYVAFGVRVTDLNPQRANITLDKYTLMIQFLPPTPGTGGGTARGYTWYIVSNSSNTINSNYSPITLQYGQPQTIIFASSASGSFTPYAPAISSGTIVLINLVSHGCEGLRLSSCGTPTYNYGQTMPYVTTLYY